MDWKSGENQVPADTTLCIHSLSLAQLTTVKHSTTESPCEKPTFYCEAVPPVVYASVTTMWCGFHILNTANHSENIDYNRKQMWHNHKHYLYWKSEKFHKKK